MDLGYLHTHRGSADGIINNLAIVYLFIEVRNSIGINKETSYT